MEVFSQLSWKLFILTKQVWEVLFYFHFHFFRFTFFYFHFLIFFLSNQTGPQVVTEKEKETTSLLVKIKVNQQTTSLTLTDVEWVHVITNQRKLLAANVVVGGCEAARYTVRDWFQIKRKIKLLLGNWVRRKLESKQSTRFVASLFREVNSS